MTAAKRLQGRIAIITGSDSGIGKATAIAFAQEGANVAVTYFTDIKGAEETVLQVEKAGQKAVLLQLDQRDPGQVRQMFDEVENQLGTPDVLVNNSGVGFSGKPVAEQSPEDWDNVIRTNLYGPFFCCQQFVQRREGKQGRAAIINISSVHEDIPVAGAAAYCASKAGLKNLAKSLALELAEKNITVNNIAPGMVLTPMNQGAIDDPQRMDQQVQWIPLKRAGRPEEIAKAAVFLASEDALYIHGTTLTVDGALTLNLGQGA